VSRSRERCWSRMSRVRAKQDADGHQRLIEKEMAKLAAQPTPTATPDRSEHRTLTAQIDLGGWWSGATSPVVVATHCLPVDASPMTLEPDGDRRA
jgi:hypothetical protein